jgi:hypothetical protein
MSEEHTQPHELDEGDDATPRAEPRSASERAFNWPPTMEELESIQVLAMHDVPEESQQLAPPTRREIAQTATTRTGLVMPLVSPRDERVRRSTWRRLIEDSVVAQAGLMAASLAAIGIAVTSLLSPAQPATRHARSETPPALATPMATPAPAPPIALPAAPPAFEQMVTLETRPREESPWLQPRRAKSPATMPAGPRASAPDASDANGTVPRAGESTAAARERVNAAASRSSLSRPADRRAARRAGSDPVSRFAVRTGTSFWKALRVVGRSFKRDDDRAWSSRPTARAAVARRTAAAVDFEAGSAPSAR